MSVEPRDALGEFWTRWQGHVINGVFPLGRFVGCSDHSGVFLTRADALHRSPLAIKLVPTNRALAELLLPRWKRAGSLIHPHLLRSLEWGGCQLDGSPHLYLVMEYADQTLAQLLQHRALTDEEARELLPPVLEALSFLHARHLVHGQLKPSNILVVGDQLKLASDTIRRPGEAMPGHRAPTVYDAPETRLGDSSTASDIWGFGVSLFEALTRQVPTSLQGAHSTVMLPADLSPAFRKRVASCLSVSPEDRPSVAELMTWVSAPTTEPAAPAAAQPGVSHAAPSRAGIEGSPRQAERREPTRQPSSRRSVMPAALVLAAASMLALIGTAARLLKNHPGPVRQSAALTAPTGASAQPEAVAQNTPAAQGAPSTGRTTGAPEPATAAKPAALSVLRAAIPDVPLRARQTIHGHIQVWVAVGIDPNGSVGTVETERAGPSRYFHRLALQAAKKWTFSPSTSAARRRMQIRFDFSREGTKGRALSAD
jgi:TonB family protein